MTLRRLVKRYLRKRSGLSKQIWNSFIISAKINDSGIFIDWLRVLKRAMMHRRISRAKNARNSGARAGRCWR